MTAPARIWVTRTLPGAEATAARLRLMGHVPLVRPLLAVRTLEGAMNAAPFPHEIACLALTSPNTLDAIRNDIARYSSLPAYAVGDTTACAARKAGFKHVFSASGDIQALADMIRREAPIGPVFAPGAQRPAGDLPALLPDRNVIRLAVYATDETDVTIPEDIDLALVHSPRAARALAKLLSISPRPLDVIAISQAAAQPFSGFSDVHVTIADHPDEDAMLRTLGNSSSAV
ncbi:MULTISPECIES: uroporphyrinogen-III synthase [unclassified Brevundimonas]|uniref:uroporphyrinogen-III synthase n=1 Tax=unclassified Brevundimonas TaxID=2622653 RepID=UPI0025B7E8A7|nr:MULTISPECIES: uroporphyrinogen-III synthase [unclassified Brevundimonas]